MKDGPTIGDMLRSWRERKGYSLETAAHLVEQRALLRNIDPSSKKVPRTHASLSRWETGRVDVKELGLSLIAEAYGITPDVLRRPPPDATRPPRQQIEVNEEHADMVRAFIHAVEGR